MFGVGVWLLRITFIDFLLCLLRRMLLFVIFGRVMGEDLIGDDRLGEEENLCNLIALRGF